MQVFTGIVETGEKRGTALGFPTANIPLTSKDFSGIYAAQVTVGGKAYQAAVYADQLRQMLEAHILDFSGDLYGKAITVELLEKIRESVRFDGDAILRAAIATDIGIIREYFKQEKK